MADVLENLKQRLNDVTALSQANALLEWDLQVKMPSAGAAARSRHLTVLSRILHDMFVDPETGELIEAGARATYGADYDSNDASLIRVARRDYAHESKLPTELVSEVTRVTALAHEIWANARAKNDFKSFAPILKQIVELKQRTAECYGYTDHPYDALIDVYEPGMKMADVESMFATLREDLVPLVKAIGERVHAVDNSIVHQPFDVEAQRQFAETVIKQFGYDFSRGRLDVAVHPFATSFSRDDVRITTRYDANWLNPALFGTLHETGHALYELGSAEDLEGTFLVGGTSLGVHESQSRMWENLVGRSRGFWTHYFPILQTYFPDQLGGVTLEAFYRAINRVEPSFIRVEADEATYNLHIMMRFELECALLTGELKVDDLPDAWNAKSQQYLGITPPTDTLGVLQDIHWSGGMIGYFPTYSIGNLLSVQLYDKAVEQHPTIPAEIEQGKFSTLLGWMHENIHKHGRKYEPKELVMRATGEPLQSRSYMAYLKKKYSEIYGL